MQSDGWDRPRALAASGALLCFAYFNASGPIAFTTGMFAEVDPGPFVAATLLIGLLATYLAARGFGFWIALAFWLWVAAAERSGANLNGFGHSYWPLGVLLQIRFLLPAIALAQVVRSSPARWRPNVGAAGFALLGLLSANLPSFDYVVPGLNLTIPTITTALGLILLLYAAGSLGIQRVSVWRPSAATLAIALLAVLFGTVMFYGRFVAYRQIGDIRRVYTDLGLVMGCIFAILPFREVSRVMIAAAGAICAFLAAQYWNQAPAFRVIPSLFGLGAAVGIVAVGIVLSRDDGDGVAASTWGASFTMWNWMVLVACTVLFNPDNPNLPRSMTAWWIAAGLAVFALSLAFGSRLNRRPAEASQ